MDKLGMFKKMLPGLMPLLVYVLAEAIWGTTIGLIVAVVVGNTQLILIWIREKRLDRFVLFDTLLIIALGLVSIALENEVFFKLKPALIGLLLCIFLGISSFSKRNLILMMSERYMKGVKLSDIQLKQFNRSLQIMFWIFSAHTLLVIYAAVYMSKEAWIFISTILFYILFGGYFAYEFVRGRILNKKIAQNVEWFPIVNEEGRVTGKATREHCHSGSKLLHPVVHLHIINKSKQIFLQKRPIDKDIQPGKWDTAVGGHVSVNESIEDALKRETKEELGIIEFDSKPIATYKWESDRECELVFSHIALYDKRIYYNPVEVADGRFWSIKEINENLNNDTFTPNFIVEFEILKKYLRIK